MPKYSFEIATNTPTEVWRIKDRTFWDRRLTLGEKGRAWSAGEDLPILAAALSTLKVEGEDITPEWLLEVLTDDTLSVTFAFILGGADGVAKLLTPANG